MSPGEQAPTGQTTISCYLDEVPDFIEGALASRYETLHSSLPFFRVWRSMESVNCYVAWRDGKPADILLFRCTQRQVIVLNEMIVVAPEGLQRFARHVFEHFPCADLIRFNAIDTATAGLGYPAQRFNAKDNFVISLPDTPEAYMASLGKSTRANLRSRLNNIRKHFPSFAARLLVGEAIGGDVVRDIARLSEHRIGAQGVKLRHDVDRMIALTRACGFVTVLSIDGRLCAGSINYRVGDGIFGEVTAHDPAYERHGLGALCVYHTICESINAGGRKFYLGGGAFGFKERMLGQRIDMDQLQIYRSRSKVLVHLDLALSACVQGQARRLKQALHRRKGTLPANLVFRLFHALKNKQGK